MDERAIEVRELDLKRFNALVGGSRSPALEFFGEEIAWYSNEDESILGVVLLDIIDKDYVAVLLARDEGRRYRCFDLECALSTRDAAREWLIRAIKWDTGQGLKP